jgi:hypothetical protein
MGERIQIMKQGAYINKEEIVPSWASLMAEFISSSMDKEDFEGSFKPLNFGIGWSINENQEKDRQVGTCKDAHPCPCQ